MRYFLLLVLSVGSFVSHSQKLAVEWGELSRKKGSTQRLMPSRKGEFYALRWVGSRLFGSYQITYHKDLKVVADRRIKVQVNNSIATFEGVRVIDGVPVVFLSDKRDGQNQLFARILSKDLSTIVRDVKVAAYTFQKRHSRGFFVIEMSNDKSHFAIIWELEGRKDSEHIYGFKVYTKDFELVNEGEYPLPFESRLSDIKGHYVSNQGDYFVATTEYSLNETKRLYRNQLTFEALHFFHIDETGLMDYSIELENKKIHAAAMMSNDSAIFTVTGIYGSDDESGVRGVFYQRVDLNKNKKLAEGFKEFNKDFITQGWTDKAKKRARKKEEKGKSEAQLYNYAMREVLVRPDGSIVGTMEQYYIQVRSFNDGQMGESNSTYYYYYNDIISYKIDSSGNFLWLKKIPKYQVSTNDGGPYSSYLSFVDQGKMYFIFNDNIQNYTDAGTYADPDEIFVANYSKRKNVVALASIDLDTGQKKREMLLERSKIKTLAVPKLFEVNYDTGELFIYTIIGRKEMIGCVNFRD